MELMRPWYLVFGRRVGGDRGAMALTDGGCRGGLARGKAGSERRDDAGQGCHILLRLKATQK